MFSLLEYKPYESRDIFIVLTISSTKNYIWHTAEAYKCF